MGELVEKLGDLLLRLWERGQSFLWGVASAGAAVFAILFAGWWYAWAPVVPLFESYAVPSLLTAVVAGILGVWRKLEDRPKPTVHLIADDGQSFWAQSRQPDGRVTTQFCFRMQATNLTGGPIKLSTLKLVRPRIRRSDNELARHVLTRNPTDNTYGFEFPIMPRAVSHASCDVIVDRAIGTPGKMITAVVKISDQQGRWHKVKFEKLRCINQGPV